MPYLPFRHPKNGKRRNIYVGAKEPAENFQRQIDEKGTVWKRVFEAPQLAMAGLKPVDPYSEKAFVNKTGQMKGTLGDLWDASRELSERRAEKDGVDGVKQKFFDQYAKQHKGRRHMNEKAEKHKTAIKDLNTKLKKFDVEIGLT